ncbi:hypothetical protein [Enterococcus faecalis]|uniref:hypothetical protein n=3 Tax=Enterococcus faecalis TaxID=1351 RepID=UPI001E58155E|nr:hypothetical protein [Enterococcus faecalis]
MLKGIDLMRRYIQSIGVYEDEAITSMNSQRIFINPIPAFVLEKGTEHLSFIVVLTIINVPVGAIVKSSFEKIEENEIRRINNFETDLSQQLSIIEPNNTAEGVHSQMVFHVEADAIGFGYYVIKVGLEVSGEIIEQDTILIPVKKEVAQDE